MPSKLIVESFIGKHVFVKLFGGDCYKGILHKTQDKYSERDINLMIPKNYYFVEGYPTIFRTSHIVEIREQK